MIILAPNSTPTKDTFTHTQKNVKCTISLWHNNNQLLQKVLLLINQPLTIHLLAINRKRKKCLSPEVWGTNTVKVNKRFLHKKLSPELFLCCFHIKDQWVLDYYRVVSLLLLHSLHMALTGGLAGDALVCTSVTSTFPHISKFELEDYQHTTYNDFSLARPLSWRTPVVLTHCFLMIDHLSIHFWCWWQQI